MNISDIKIYKNIHNLCTYSFFNFVFSSLICNLSYSVIQECTIDLFDKKEIKIIQINNNSIKPIQITCIYSDNISIIDDQAIFIHSQKNEGSSIANILFSFDPDLNVIKKPIQKNEQPIFRLEFPTVYNQFNYSLTFIDSDRRRWDSDWINSSFIKNGTYLLNPYEHGFQKNSVNLESLKELIIFFKPTDKLTDVHCILNPIKILDGNPQKDKKNEDFNPLPKEYKILNNQPVEITHRLVYAGYTNEQAKIIAHKFQNVNFNTENLIGEEVYINYVDEPKKIIREKTRVNRIGGEELIYERTYIVKDKPIEAVTKKILKNKAIQIEEKIISKVVSINNESQKILWINITTNPNAKDKIKLGFS